jgi:hypothetical protein
MFFFSHMYVHMYLTHTHTHIYIYAHLRLNMHTVHVYPSVYLYSLFSVPKKRIQINYDLGLAFRSLNKKMLNY